MTQIDVRLGIPDDVAAAVSVYERSNLARRHGDWPSRSARVAQVRASLHVTLLESKGESIAAIDSLIAACALQGGYTLVTRNEDDFQNTGVTIINPWK